MAGELWFAQLVGLIAFLMGVTAFWQKDDQAFRRQLTAYCAMICAHFFLMGAPAAGIAAAMSGLRSLVSSHTRNGWIMFGFLLAIWALGLPKVQDPMQLLPMLGTSLGTYGLFRLQGIAMRLCMMGVNLLWLGHNLWLGSWGGSLIESVFFVVNIITIYRLHKRPVLPEVPD